MGAIANLSEYFDRVTVINLARRPERLARFWQLLGQWPFKTPQRFEAVDGLAVGVPPGWEKGPGAWGCLVSHRIVLKNAIDDGVRALLVLEDDAFPVDNFASQSARFLQNVPDDWDGLMFGAEHLQPPVEVVPGVVRCVAANRSHAYAVRGPFMEVLRYFWDTTNDHCDIVISSLMRRFKLYAPDPFLIGQDAGPSDVTGRKEALRFLSASDKERIADTDPRYSLEKLIVRVNMAKPPALASIKDR
jgi:hypothetical protein